MTGSGAKAARESSKRLQSPYWRRLHFAKNQDMLTLRAEKEASQMANSVVAVELDSTEERGLESGDRMQ